MFAIRNIKYEYITIDAIYSNDSWYLSTGFGKFNLKIMAVCSLIFMNVAFSITSIGFVLPSAACDFRMTTVDKGRMSAAPMLGNTRIISILLTIYQCSFRHINDIINYFHFCIHTWQQQSLSVADICLTIILWPCKNFMIVLFQL